MYPPPDSVPRRGSDPPLLDVEKGQKLLLDVKNLLDEASAMKQQLEDKAKQEQDRKDVQREEHTSEALEEVVQLDKLSQVCQWTDTLSGMHQAALDLIQEEEEKEKQEGKTGQALQKLDNVFTNLCNMTETLNKSQCEHLRRFSRVTQAVVYAAVAAGLKEGLEADLLLLNYPECVLSEEVQPPLAGTTAGALFRFKARFTLCCKMAALMERQEKNTEDENEDNMVPQLYHPHSSLLAPLKKRFQFHFCGQMKTNSLVRPEWYLQQVLLWLKNIQRFFDHFLGGLTGSDAGARQFVLLCQKVSVLVTEKLNTDVGKVLEEDVLLSHTLDEVIAFTKESGKVALMRGVKAESLPISILAHEEIFRRWLALERKLAFEKLDSLFLEQEQGWAASVSDPMVPRCVETFLTLLQSLFSRFRELRSPVLQVEFVRLQSDLVEDFRMRLVKVQRGEGGLFSVAAAAPLEDKKCLIINAANHLVETLETWCETPLYLHLQVLFEDAKDIFTAPIEGLMFMIGDLSRVMAEHIFAEVKDRSGSYRASSKWFGANEDEIDPTSPSPESLGVLQSLTANLHRAHVRLAPDIFSRVLEIVLRDVSRFLLDDVVLRNKFDALGVTQLVADVDYGVAPIFRSATAGNAGLVRVREALTLLQMKEASAVLLLESLRAEREAGDATAAAKKTLAEFKVNVLAPAKAAEVLERRVELMDVM